MTRRRTLEQWKYLYRAIDRRSNTVDFLLRAHRDKTAARRCFERAIDQNGEPETITLDKSGADLAALGARNAERSTPIYSDFPSRSHSGRSLPCNWITASRWTSPAMIIKRGRNTTRFW
jgi:transposase-like protein